MGVTTSVFPKGDCGAMQQGCGNDKGPELSDKDFALEKIDSKDWNLVNEKFQD